MTIRIPAIAVLLRFVCICWVVAAVAGPPDTAHAQTYGAQQSVRRSLDNLGGSPTDAERVAGPGGAAPVSYSRDVLPILQANCHNCHQAPRARGGLDTTSFDNLLRGGESGQPAVVPGDPESSYLVQQITPVGGRAAMPQRRPPLAATEIALIRRWISEGAANDGSAESGRDSYSSERGQPYAASTGSVDTSYVSPTAIAVVAMRPAQAMASPLAQLLPSEVFTAFLGFDPTSVEEIVVFVDPVNLMGPTTYGATFKFTAPFRAATIRREIRAHAQLSEFAGKRYLQSQHPIMPSFFGPDNRTLLVAPDAALRRLVETRGQPKSGALHERLRTAPSGNDLYVAVDMAALRPFAQMGIAQAQASGSVPPPAQKYLELPKLISALELTFNVSDAGPMSLVLHAADETAAGQLETLLVQAADPYQSAASRGDGSDPVAMAVAQYADRVSQPFRPQRVGNSVTLFQIEGQNPARQQLASLAVLGVQVAVQAARTAMQQAAMPPAPTATGGEVIESTPPAEGAEATQPQPR
jgi:hypothetical protein